MVAKYDVVIVGGGILGMSCAYHLKSWEPDLSVMVIDQNPRGGMGNTSKSAALFRNVFSSPVNRILASVSLAFYRRLQKEEKIDLGLRYTGYLWLCDQELGKLFSQLRMKEHQFSQSMSYPELQFMLKDVTTETLTDMFGCDPSERTVEVGGEMDLKLPKIEHAIFGPDCGTLSPAKLFEYYERKFKEMGGELLYRTKVEKILFERSQVEPEPHDKTDSNHKIDFGLERSLHFTGLRTVDGIVKADKICLAAGTWTNLLTDPLGIDVHMKPKSRQLFNVVIEPDKQPKGFINKEERFPIFVLPPDGIYVKPLRMRGNFIIGWADDLGRSFGFEEEPKADFEFFQKYINPALTAYLPWFEGAEIKHSWAGQYHYNTLDGNPFVFNTRNLTCVVGASGSGVMKADAIGKITAAKVLEKDKPDLMEGVDFPIDALGFDTRLVVKEQLII
jgi:glycine/D-amino acid oxidase-like deaminating enzyme